MKESDRGMILGLKKILEDGTFPLQVREVPTFWKIYNWVKDLEGRIPPPKVVSEKKKKEKKEKN